MGRPYQQCNRCVMDTSDVDITFDDRGICNHCINYDNKLVNKTYKAEISEKKLEQLVNKIKISGKGKEYDCVVGVSGGIDSSYVAFLVKKLGLRPLLVHMDNGWNSEISVKNIKNIAEKLGLEYQSYVLDWNNFKDVQYAFLKASIPEMETPTDIAIPEALHSIAAEYGVKYIISGGNYATEGILPKTWHYDAKDAKYFFYILKKFSKNNKLGFPFLDWKREVYYKFVKGIRIIYLLNYVDYDKKHAMDVLEQELGWKYYGGKHYESKYTGFVQSYILPKKFNIDYRRATLSTQICAGTITRKEALKELENLSYSEVKVKLEQEYVCKKLGISKQEFEEIMLDKPKIYRDYPNNEKFLNFIYDLYRKIFS